MKRLISTLLLLTCMLSFSNCSSEDYDEKYSDPNKVTKLLIDKLTVGIFIKENNFAIQGYGRYYSSDTQWLGKYAQCTGFNTGNIMYYNGYSVDSYYGDLYSSAANFKKLEQMNLSLESTYNQGSGFSWVRENGFFWRNENWDHQIYSAAETWFIKAEAYQNGWASGDAKAAFTEGIKQSIRFFFKYQKNNSRSDYKQDEKGTERRAYVITPEEPSDEWINQFAEARWSKRIDGSSYDSSNPQIDAIMTQKWLSFNLLYVREAWSDLRRTGYPSGLVFPKVSDPERT